MNEPLIQEALEKYGLENAPWTLIRHNENMTVNVDDRYLLRVHLHADGLSTDALYEDYDPITIRKTELSFLSYLARNGLSVQTPVPNQNGELLTMLQDGTWATLLRWIPGRTPNEEDVPKGIYFRVGAMTARMHQAAAGFPLENMLRYDASLCRRLEAWLDRAHMERLLSSEHTEILRAASRIMENRLELHAPIAVHADLSSSNILVTETGLVPIDFSLMGAGHPMMDISSLYGSVNGVEARREIAEGYCSDGGVISFPELDACFALNLLLYIALHLRGIATDERFLASLDRWSKQIFAPLAEGRRLFGDDFLWLIAP